MSTEVSAFIICLITLDRFLALRFPFSSLHFSRSSALVASATVWMVGVALATVPLLPLTSHWEFYSQTGICIPLPVNKSTAVDLAKAWLSEQVLTPGDIVSRSAASCDGQKKEVC